MAYNDFTIGRDSQIDFTDALGNVQSFPVIIRWRAKQATADQKVVQLDGTVTYLKIPSGWEGDLEYERQNSNLDNFFSDREAEYYSGVNFRNASLTSHVSDPDYSVHEWRFTNVAFGFEDVGDWAGDKTVKQKVAWGASRRIIIRR